MNCELKSGDVLIAEKYYTNTAKVKLYQGTNDRGDTVYASEISVPCRFDYDTKETIDSKGNQVVSTANMLCSMFIPPLSIISDECNNRFTVKSCKRIQSVFGETDHYEVVL